MLANILNQSINMNTSIFNTRITISTYKWVYYLKNILFTISIITCGILIARCLYLEEINNNIKNKNKILEYQNNIIREYDKDISNKLNSIINDMNILDEENISLIKSNNEYYNTLKEYSLREELYDKYSYILYDTSGKRNDITFNQLKTSESILVKNGLDPNILYAIIKVESNGYENAKNKNSTATGYGQLLVSTGKSIYENYMNKGKGSFSHSILYNGDTNIIIASNYLVYLKKHSNNIYQVVNGYRGMNDRAYTTKLNKYLKYANTSLAQINRDVYINHIKYTISNGYYDKDYTEAGINRYLVYSK